MSDERHYWITATATTTTTTRHQVDPDGYYNNDNHDEEVIDHDNRISNGLDNIDDDNNDDDEEEEKEEAMLSRILFESQQTFLQEQQAIYERIVMNNKCTINNNHTYSNINNSCNNNEKYEMNVEREELEVEDDDDDEEEEEEEEEKKCNYDNQAGESSCSSDMSQYYRVYDNYYDEYYFRSSCNSPEQTAITSRTDWYDHRQYNHKQQQSSPSITYASASARVPAPISEITTTERIVTTIADDHDTYNYDGNDYYNRLVRKHQEQERDRQQLQAVPGHDEITMIRPSLQTHIYNDDDDDDDEESWYYQKIHGHHSYQSISYDAFVNHTNEADNIIQQLEQQKETCIKEYTNEKDLLEQQQSSISILEYHQSRSSRNIRRNHRTSQGNANQYHQSIDHPNGSLSKMISSLSIQSSSTVPTVCTDISSSSSPSSTTPILSNEMIIQNQMYILQTIQEELSQSQSSS